MPAGLRREVRPPRRGSPQSLSMATCRCEWASGGEAAAAAVPARWPGVRPAAPLRVGGFSSRCVLRVGPWPAGGRLPEFGSGTKLAPLAKHEEKKSGVSYLFCVFVSYLAA